MTSLQEAKSVVLNYYDSLDSAQSADELKLCFEKNTPRDYLWRGFHPFGEIKTEIWLSLISGNLFGILSSAPNEGKTFFLLEKIL